MKIDELLILYYVLFWMFASAASVIVYFQIENKCKKHSITEELCKILKSVIIGLLFGLIWPISLPVSLIFLEIADRYENR